MFMKQEELSEQNKSEIPTDYIFWHPIFKRPRNVQVPAIVLHYRNI